MPTRDWPVQRASLATNRTMYEWTSMRQRGSSCTSFRRRRSETLSSIGKQIANSTSLLILLLKIREQLQRNAREGNFFLRISIDRMLGFDEVLAQQVRQKPEMFIPSLEKAIQNVYKNNYHDSITEVEGEEVPSFQVQIQTDENPRMLRDLQSNLVGQLVVIPGIITSASRTNIKATSVTWKCSNCGHELQQAIKFGFGGSHAPRQCAQAKNPGADKQMCPLDPYRI